MRNVWYLRGLCQKSVRGRKSLVAQGTAVFELLTRVRWYLSVLWEALFYPDPDLNAPKGVCELLVGRGVIGVAKLNAFLLSKLKVKSFVILLGANVAQALPVLGLADSEVKSRWMRGNAFLVIFLITVVLLLIDALL